jgi:pimeloyl-ACP methyl ester carboxylesterase
MSTVTVGDVDLYFEEYGQGPPVLLIHGLAGDCSAWNAQIERLERSYRVIAFDNRGAGRSSAPDYPYTTRHFADDTVGLLDALGISEPAHIIGRSMGGAIAQEIALAYPHRTRSLIITASFGKLDSYGYQILDSINEVVKVQGYGLASKIQSLFFFPPDYFNEHRQQMKGFEVALADTNRPIHGYTNSTHACLTHDSVDRLPRIACPTLVLAGGQDVLCAVGASQQIADRIPGCELKVYEDASHFFLIQCFEESMQDIESFLERN